MGRTAGRRAKLAGVAWAAGAVFVVLGTLWLLSVKGVVFLTFTNADSPAGLIGFLESHRDELRGIKVNGHFLDVGKRPSLQILKGYGKPMYLMRPHRQVRLKTRNLTKPEIVDFCTNISGNAFENLKAMAASGKGATVAWTGRIEGKTVRIIKPTLFSYLVYGLSGKPMFITQVELAKRLGMTEDFILSHIIPVQQKWYDELAVSPLFKSSYPVEYLPPVEDELLARLGGTPAP